MSTKESVNNVQEFHDISIIGDSSNDENEDDLVVKEEYDPSHTFHDRHGHSDVGIHMPENHFHEDIQLSHSNKKLEKYTQSNNKNVEETSFQNANPLKIKVSNGDSHDEIQFLESILIKENKNAELEVSTSTNKETDLSNSNLSTPQNNNTGNISHWFKFVKSLKSVDSAEKCVVTDKQQPLTWKTKLQYITLCVGVAILLVILVVIAVITSDSIKEDDTVTKPPAIEYVHALMDLTVNASFTSALQNKESYKYMTFLSDFCLEIDKIYRNTTTGIGESYVGCSILKLRSGSIIVSFTVYAVKITEEYLRSIVEDILQKHLLTSDKNMLGRFQIIISSLRLIQVTTIHLNDPPEVQAQLPSTTHSIVTDSTTKQSSTLPSQRTTVDTNTKSTEEPTSSTSLSQSTAPKPNTTTTAEKTKTTMATVPDVTSTVGVNSQSTSIMASTQEYLNTSDDENTASTQNTTMSPSTVDTPPISTHISTTGTSQNTLTSTTSYSSPHQTTVSTTDSTVAQHTPSSTVDDQTVGSMSTSSITSTNIDQQTTTSSTVDDQIVGSMSTPSITSTNSDHPTTTSSTVDDQTVGSMSTSFITSTNTDQQTTASSTVDDQTVGSMSTSSITSTNIDQQTTTSSTVDDQIVGSMSTPFITSTNTDQQTTTSSTTETTVNPPAVNGTWSSWSFWGGCLATCGVSLRQRNRKCDNPVPLNGGKYCVGNDTEYISCTMDNCPIDGMWADWSEWSSCNVTCEGGIRIKHRTCTNPYPKFGGLHCVGCDSDTSVCNDNPCPIDGRWSDWSNWNQCDVTCGIGSTFRTRSCTTPQHGGHACIGNDTDIMACTTEPCPVDGAWSIWSNWGDCSLTCGDDGSRDRQRSCSAPAPQFGGSECIGNNTETGSCEDTPCAIDGQWSAWNAWGHCTHTCGDGYKSRTRECSNPPPMYGGDFCEGFPQMYTGCAENPCIVQGYWTSWSDWGACNASCGGGIRVKQRTCFNQDVGDDALLVCIGDDTENDTCNTNECPIDGGWSEWIEWEECSVTCGTGIKSRNRTCTNPVPNDGGEYCVGNDTEINLCNTRYCPGGSCTSASVYLHGESVYIVCTITGMVALLTMTVKHNEQDIAILKETEDVQYVADTDIVISVVYDENTTVLLYFRNVTCNEEGIYRIEVQDDTFNGLDIMSTLSIKVKPTVPIFYVNSNKLNGMPYRREDYQHQCFGNVGKPAGQLVIEFQPFNTSPFKAIPSSNLVILNNSTRNIDCYNFQNLTFLMNLTTEIEHGKLRCRVINDEILINELVASEEDLSAWPRNMCTDVVRFINDGPATMTCTMNRTKTFDEIQIIKIKDSEMTNISKIDNNGNIQYLSSANIEITSAQKYEIDLKFQNISCADEGHYILVIIKELKMIATVSGTLTPQSKPTDPTLIINPNIVIDSSLPLTGHRCYGNVGYPPGELALDISIVFEGERKYFEIPEDIITSLNDVRYIENCEGYQNFTFTLNASSIQNGKILRCRVKTSFLDNDVFADESYLTLIPKDICKCNTIVSGIRRGHPGRCDHYVECVNMTVPVGKPCPDAQCRRSMTGICTNDCSENVCNETVPEDFCGPTTMQITTKSTRIQAAAVQCNNTFAVFSSAPAILICVLNNTAFNSIHITKLANNETQWIGRVNPDTSVELSQFSIYQNITLKLVNTELIITFDVVSCDSGGIYDVTVMLDDREDVSNCSLTILRKPRQPILQMNPDQVIYLGFYRQGHAHVCSGDVGEPPGNLVIEMKYYNSSSFEPVLDENIDIQSTQFNKQTCRNTTMTVVFGLLFTPEMDGGRIRCRVENTPSMMDNEIIADSKDLALIQESICKCNTNSTATRGHPTVCDVFVRCTNYTVPMGLSCPLSTCRDSITGECNSDCSTEACSIPVPKDFCSD